MKFDLQITGADAVMLYFPGGISAESTAQVQHAATLIERALGQDLVDLIPSYASLLVIYNPLASSHTAIAGRIRKLLAGASRATVAEGREVVLPVYYAQEAGQDLEAIARTTGLSPAEVIEIHSGTRYRVHAIGFAPGFAYMGVVDERIARARLDTPRTRVPRGSVGIAERQTAVYPCASPGGWNLIGRCPTPMFDPEGKPPMPVAVGDQVCFQPISRSDYLAMGGELT